MRKKVKSTERRQHSCMLQFLACTSVSASWDRSKWQTITVQSCGSNEWWDLSESIMVVAQTRVHTQQTKSEKKLPLLKYKTGKCSWLSQSCGRSSPRCCTLWSVWRSTPPGTRACVRSQRCWRWRWCRWSLCSRRRSSGLCCAPRFLTPTQRWSPGPSSPNKKNAERDQWKQREIMSVFKILKNF